MTRRSVDRVACPPRGAPEGRRCHVITPKSSAPAVTKASGRMAVHTRRKLAPGLLPRSPRPRPPAPPRPWAAPTIPPRLCWAPSCPWPRANHPAVV